LEVIGVGFQIAVSRCKGLLLKVEYADVRCTHNDPQNRFFVVVVVKFPQLAQACETY
jgi:hypothetical protein